MPYTNYLKTGLDNGRGFNVPGAARLMLVNRDAIQSLFYDGELVEQVVLRVGEGWNMFQHLEDLRYTVVPETTKNGTLYGVEISFTVTIQTDAKNRMFDAMRETDLAAVVQDNNRRWWLIGHEQPLRLTQQDQKVDKDGNQYSVKLQNRQRQNVKGLNTEFVAQLFNQPFNPVLDSIDGVTLDIRVATTTGGSTGTPGGGDNLPNNFLNTITAPPTGYVILDSIGVVFASAGTIIKLPVAAQNGEQHTVKDYTGLAETAPITIDGNGKLIDGAEKFKVNSNYGSATFTFNNNAWLVSAFVE
ncbi:hypothetical protein [Solirubrum puertoriconensis]|uniref:hypothetical protein n=1 Tax=Solirubrum puertoriconensis TaxID=1751427 RepID=UPI00122E9DCF|nr:hypothetical protein [Solirubrum puertoriconensis]